MTTLRQAQAQATRERLIEVATRLFAADGYAAVTTTTLSEAAGMTRGALYHHFANMGEVMAAVLARSERALVERVAHALDGHPEPGAKFLALGPSLLRVLAEDPTTQRIVFLEAPAALGWTRWRAIDEGRSLALIAGLLTELRERGQLAEGVDPHLTAQLLLGAINEAGMRVAATDGRDRAAAATQLTLLCRGLLA
ncbi:TetR family transcriptional regulator [Nocardia farcinica]|uniref:TetR family transcriptional regulator n=1 Tax=Nocardia TaxID=1817 RepID=UPI000BF10851|nr:MULTISPECIES: TetR family transcriptional regulator [Nocardia]MBF6184141.1 TetR family transcriptional regulator [Nocardia farcinica]MBF6258112.1 TetR family transcriptional regulator [Nocardia farcinica]MBF6290751.1 TetR family transcriptional regulator [Nocardia farcinica]MBF6309984.1 TetR family transcriptional regulator [Nocardia farcinica]MBF6377924.1 TetR family transcriptional regulator [Nocardia farcinica]